MANTVITLKKSGTPLAAPGSLANGEIAINYADGKLFYKDSTGSIQQISGGGNNFSTINAAGTLVVADLQNDILTLDQGDNIVITGDIVNDKITIAANLAPAFDKANLAWELANTANSKPAGSGGGATVSTSDTPPGSPVDGDMWWNSAVGKLYVYYDDGSSSQWVEASGGVLYSTNTLAALAFAVANGAFDKANNALANTSNTTFGGDLNITGNVRVSGNLLVGTSTVTITNNSIFATTLETTNLVVNGSAVPSGAVSNLSFDTANAAYDKANAANLLAYGTGIGANGYSDTVGLSANNYAGVMANAANTWANTKVDTITSNSTTRIWANSSVVTGIETVYVDLANSGVTAATYGDSGNIPSIVVDAYGRITSASNVAVAAGGAYFSAY